MRTAILLVAALWLGLLIGAQLGIARGRTLGPARIEASVAPQRAPNPCGWSAADLAAELHAAEVYLSTAERSHVPAVKQAWAALAQATLQRVAVCAP